jgi:hypothetical protein
MPESETEQINEVNSDENPASEAYQNFWGCVIQAFLALLCVGAWRVAANGWTSSRWGDLLLCVGPPFCIYLIGKYGLNPPGLSEATGASEVTSGPDTKPVRNSAKPSSIAELKRAIQ